MKYPDPVECDGASAIVRALGADGEESLPPLEEAIEQSVEGLKPIEDRWAMLLAQAGRLCEPLASLIGALGRPADPEKNMHFLAAVDPKAALISRVLRELRQSWKGPRPIVASPAHDRLRIDEPCGVRSCASGNGIGFDFCSC